MRALAVVLVFAACSSPARPASRAAVAPPPETAVAPPPASPSPAAPAVVQPAESLAADTPSATVAGNAFIAPAGWSRRVQGAGTILEAPERGSFVAIYDLPATDADGAVAQAWKLYRTAPSYAQKTSIDGGDRDGWTKVRSYDYVVSPNEQRTVRATAMFANGSWTVVIIDLADAIAGKRGAQVQLVLGKLLPKGQARESFAGKAAHPLDAVRIAALRRFVEDAAKTTGVPGVSFGIVQGGKVVYAGGVGVRELGKPAKVDGDTKFMIASNTKALATLMLAKLVDANKITWETKATSLLPSFKLGDADTTSQVMVKHLICACTGLPRQDLEWLFQWGELTPEKVIAVLGTMQPTSKFGELFQYSNTMAAAAGFIGGHVAYPTLELGAAFDKAMQTMVFDPLGMTATTFVFAKGTQGNAALPHSADLTGKPALAIAKVNTAATPLRPAGAAWSSVKDMLKYVQMELAEGALPSGKRYIGKEALLARRAPQVSVGPDETYGMGLEVDARWGVEVVHHGGDLIGFHSDMMWLPAHGVGAVVLTNGDPGELIRDIFQRKLLEVLFDGKPEADAALALGAKAFFANREAASKLISAPADAAEAGKLAARYASPVLGGLAVKKHGQGIAFDFGEYTSEMGSKRNPDGTVSFVTVAPGLLGLELVVGSAGGKRTLTIRDAQHAYAFTEE